MAPIRVNMRMLTAEELNDFVNEMEEQSRIKGEKLGIQRTTPKRQLDFGLDAITENENSLKLDKQRKRRGFDFSGTELEKLFIQESINETDTLSSDTYIIDTRAPVPESQLLDVTLENFLEEELQEDFKIKIFLKKTKKMLKRSLSKSLRYVTM